MWNNLSRHFTLLRELNASASTEDLWVITVSWSESAERAERAPTLVSTFPAGTYWQSVPDGRSDPEDPVWMHVYVGATSLASSDLRALLLLVADDGTREVIVGPPGAEWLYHPYDGGGDVIAPDRATRGLLRERHTAWLSARPTGL